MESDFNYVKWEHGQTCRCFMCKIALISVTQQCDIEFHEDVTTFRKTIGKSARPISDDEKEIIEKMTEFEYAIMNKLRPSHTLYSCVTLANSFIRDNDIETICDELEKRVSHFVEKYGKN